MVKKQAWELVIKDRFLNSEKKDNPFIMGFLYFIIVLLSFLLIFIVFFQLCFIIGDSMNPGIKDGNHVLLLKSNSYIKYQDVVIITKEGDDGAPINIIKRVMALEGDTIEFKTTSDGTIDFYLNNKIVDEPYIKERMKMLNSWSYARPDKGAVTIEEGFIFVMGDNRNNSLDSRSSDGPYPVKAVYGEMMMEVEKDSFLEFLLNLLYGDQKSTTLDESSKNAAVLAF